MSHATTTTTAARATRTRRPPARIATSSGEVLSAPVNDISLLVLGAILGHEASGRLARPARRRGRRRELQAMLGERFDIDHATLQIGHGRSPQPVRKRQITM